MQGSRQQYEVTWGFISKNCRCGDCQITQAAVVVVGVWLLERWRHLGPPLASITRLTFNMLQWKTTGWGSRIDYLVCWAPHQLYSPTLPYTLWWGFNWWVRSPGHVVLMSWHCCALRLALLFFSSLFFLYLSTIIHLTKSKLTVIGQPIVSHEACFQYACFSLLEITWCKFENCEAKGCF